MSLVLDASVTLAWLHPERREDAVTALLDRVLAHGAWVPSLWRLEVANVLLLGIGRGRTDVRFVQAALADLESMPIDIDSETDARAWGETLELARRHGLTVYDAAYLELAKRRGLPLATLDRELKAAAEADGVGVLAG